MNISPLYYFFNKFSKNTLYFIILYFCINIETSLKFLVFFEDATPSLLSIIIYLCIRRFSINLSNFIIFTIGILYDVLLGSNLGISSMFFLLIKFFTEYLNLRIVYYNYNDDWIYFTCIFMSSFFIIFLLHIVINSTIPDFSPVLFHIGVTLIIFPFIVMSINFVKFITKLVKN